MLAWYFVASLIFLLGAMAVSLTSPLHATFAYPLLRALAITSVAGLAGSVVLFLVSLGANYWHVMAGRAIRWLAGMLAASAIHALALAALADALNFRFDTSPAKRMTVERIGTGDIAKGDMLRMVDWRGTGEPMKAKFDTRVFQLEPGGKSVTFNLREGWLGLPYATGIDAK